VKDRDILVDSGTTDEKDLSSDSETTNGSSASNVIDIHGEADEIMIEDHTQNDVTESEVVDDADAKIVVKNQDSLVDLGMLDETENEKEAYNKSHDYHTKSSGADTIDISSDNNNHAKDNRSDTKLQDQSSELPVNDFAEDDANSIEDQGNLSYIELDDGKVVQSLRALRFPGFHAVKSFQRRPSLAQSPFHEWTFETIQSHSQSRAVELIFEIWKSRLWYEKNLSHKQQIKVEVTEIVESGFQKSGATFYR